MRGLALVAGPQKQPRNLYTAIGKVYQGHCVVGVYQYNIELTAQLQKQIKLQMCTKLQREGGQKCSNEDFQILFLY